MSGTLYKPFLPIQSASLVAKHVFRGITAGLRRVVLVVDDPDPLLTRLVAEFQSNSPNDVSVSLLHINGDTNLKVVRAADTLDPQPERLLVGLADTFCWYDPVQLYAAALRPGIDSSIAVASFRLPFGVVAVRGNLVSSFQEKPITNYLVNLGQMALGPAASGLLRQGHSLGHMLETLAKRGQLAAERASSRFLTLDSVQDVARALDFPSFE
jgi:NDP-sugar pyrophosphorylase family protein